MDGRDLRQRVVDVQDVGLQLPHHPLGVLARTGRPDRVQRHAGIALLQVPVVAQVLDDLMAVLTQQGAFLVEHGILAAAMDVAVVREQDPHPIDPGSPTASESTTRSTSARVNCGCSGMVNSSAQ